MENFSKNSNLAKPLEMEAKPTESRTWWIYMLTNPSGSKYIGKTSSIKTRMKAYSYTSGGGCNQQPILYNSLLKHGFENHHLEIIDTFESDCDFADGKEMFWIRSFMTNLNKWRDMKGMNMTDGGEGALGAKFKNRVSPFKGKKHSEEQKKHVSDYFKANPARYWLGKKIPEEFKIKMSLAKKGKPSKRKGAVLSEESKKKISLAKKGKPSILKGRKVWSDADKKRIGDSKIGNTYFKGKKHTEEFVKMMTAHRMATQGKPILIFDLNGKFIKEVGSLRLVRIETGLGGTAIREILLGITKKPKTFLLKYK